MRRSTSILALTAALLIGFGGSACDGLGPLAAGDDDPGDEGFFDDTRFSDTGEDQVSGMVTSADPEKGTLTLSGNIKVRVTAQTKVDKSGDLFLLADVRAKLLAGRTVLCDAEGFFESGVFVAKKIRLRSNDSCDTCDGDDADDGTQPGEQPSFARVKGHVTSVLASQDRFVIAGGTNVQVDGKTEFKGDLRTLAAVQRAKSEGKTVEAEVRGQIKGGVVLAVEVRFEIVGQKDDGRDDDEGDDDEDVDEIKGIVASVNLLARTCKTTEGKVIKITSDSVIDLTGDIHTLANVALQLTLGARVRVEAKGKATAEAFVASKAKFQVDP